MYDSVTCGFHNFCDHAGHQRISNIPKSALVEPCTPRSVLETLAAETKHDFSQDHASELVITSSVARQVLKQAMRKVQADFQMSTHLDPFRQLLLSSFMQELSRD